MRLFPSPHSCSTLASLLAIVIPVIVPAMAVLAVVSSSRPAAAAGSALAFPFPVKQKTLPNGLHVYVVGYDSPGLVAYYSIVRTGSRNEVEAGKSGFAVSHPRTACS